MKGKGRSRLIEWGKSLLILLLTVSAVYLLGHTQLSGDILERVQGVFNHNTAVNPDLVSIHSGSAVVSPIRLAIYREGQRYGVQYNQEEADAAFSTVSTVFSEALSSAETPKQISERAWRAALTRTGIYMDFYYPVSLPILSEQLGDGTARRICLAAEETGGVSLFFINEETGLFYVSATTLTSEVHLDTAVAERSPNGAMFAFEVPGMENVDPYTLLASTPQPIIYTVGNSLAADSGRVEDLLNALAFQSRGVDLAPTTGGLLVEGNDTLRLFDSGLLTFHTIGDSDFRFLVPENNLKSAVSFVQNLANSTAGAWCGAARLCLAGVEETDTGWEILFQYSLNGVPVILPDDNTAARFVIQNGAVTDFSLYLRTYSESGETVMVLPEMQAAAAMNVVADRGKELTLLYQDPGGGVVGVGWAAN